MIRIDTEFWPDYKIRAVRAMNMIGSMIVRNLNAIEPRFTWSLLTPGCFVANYSYESFKVMDSIRIFTSDEVIDKWNDTSPDNMEYIVNMYRDIQHSTKLGVTDWFERAQILRYNTNTSNWMKPAELKAALGDLCNSNVKKDSNYNEFIFGDDGPTILKRLADYTSLRCLTKETSQRSISNRRTA